MRRQPYLSDLWPANDGGRLLGGALLLFWGLSLAASGFGIDHGQLYQTLETYWPAPFIAWGLLGYLWHLVRGTSGTVFYLVVGALAAIVQIDNLHLAHVDVWTLIGAAVLVGLGLNLFRHLGHGGRWS